MMEKGKAWLQEMERHPKFGPLVQFVKFGLVGVSNTLISLGVYWLCYYGLHIHYQLSNLISFVISVTNAYYWNSRYVFKNGVTYTFQQHVKAYFKAFASYGSTYLLTVALMWVWVEKCGVSAGVAPLINLLITIPLNFILNKFWAFRK